MDDETHVIKAGSTTHGQFETDVNIERASWEWSFIRVLALPAGGSETATSGVFKLLMLLLSGDCAVEVSGETHMLNGREEAWNAITDYLYIPHGITSMIRSESGGQFVLPAAKATRDLPVRYYPVTEVIITLRSASPHSCQVNSYAFGNDLETPHLLAYGVLTPGGNQPSYPPHKHDEHNEMEYVLEEIYYYEVRPGLNRSLGVALQRIHPSGHDIDVCAEVHSRDVAMVPHGCHGSSMTVPGYDLHYLNVITRPAEDSI